MSEQTSFTAYTPAGNRPRQHINTAPPTMPAVPAHRHRDTLYRTHATKRHTASFCRSFAVQTVVSIHCIIPVPLKYPHVCVCRRISLCVRTCTQLLVRLVGDYVRCSKPGCLCVLPQRAPVETNSSGAGAPITHAQQVVKSHQNARRLFKQEGTRDTWTGLFKQEGTRVHVDGKSRTLHTWYTTQINACLLRRIENTKESPTSKGTRTCPQRLATFINVSPTFSLVSSSTLGDLKNWTCAPISVLVQIRHECMVSAKLSVTIIPLDSRCNTLLK